MLTSSRRSLSYPNTNRSDSADVARDIATVIAALELDVVFSQGTHASRPAAGASAPAGTGGGRLYYETDTSSLFYDTGSAWVGPLNTPAIANGSIVLAMLAANSVDGSKIVDLSVDTAELNDHAVTAAKIASALFPSQGAADATEALRRIGTGAGQVAAGADARFPKLVGRVNSNASIAAGTGFTVVDNGLGNYTVNYASLGAVPVVNVYQVNGQITLQSVSATSFTVQCQGAAAAAFAFSVHLPF